MVYSLFSKQEVVEKAYTSLCIRCHILLEATSSIAHCLCLFVPSERPFVPVCGASTAYFCCISTRCLFLLHFYTLPCLTSVRYLYPLAIRLSTLPCWPCDLLCPVPPACGPALPACVFQSSLNVSCHRHLPMRPTRPTYCATYLPLRHACLAICCDLPCPTTDLPSICDLLFSSWFFLQLPTVPTYGVESSTNGVL
ncbi:hypothetical protein O6H91_22G015200 [Diphasiastrum complanatum]|uniref:Uncharacterized protein n=1 Tax=Diphasiastrum complanatum TaxID=34168 RepID=A0ACC2AD82_DIPCM|nr:hypothetical protein O6H91_22G015200 [Diphasiastrum complanatum]